MTDVWENNIVIIGDREKKEKYVEGILNKMSPHIYNKKENGCIIIQVRESLLEFADHIVSKFKWAGLKEVSRVRKPIKTGSYTLPEAWEIKLRKIPILEMVEVDEDG